MTCGVASCLLSFRALPQSEADWSVQAGSQAYRGPNLGRHGPRGFPNGQYQPLPSLYKNIGGRIMGDDIGWMQPGT